MPTDQGFAVSMLYPIIKTIEQKGLGFEGFCRQSSFDPALLQDVEARIDERELERLMYEAAAYTQDEYFGLHQGQLTDVSDLGILGYVMIHSGTIADALAAYERYHVILCSGYSLRWEERGNGVAILICKGDSSPMSRHCCEDMVSSLYHLMMRMSNRPIPVLELQFAHAATSDLTPYLSLFGVEPRFNGNETYLLVDRDVLHYPILYSDPRLLSAFVPIAEQTRDKLMKGSVVSDRVYRWMTACLPASFPTLRQTAEAFAMSPRSLQAKLKDEGTSYNELAASVRKEMAMAYLTKQEYSIAEIAYLLHFSEPSAFQNAFKKWTGATPGQYRANAWTTYSR